jgi:GDSL-like Lipase/Acylhydrolase family
MRSAATQKVVRRFRAISAIAGLVGVVSIGLVGTPTAAASQPQSSGSSFGTTAARSVGRSIPKASRQELLGTGATAVNDVAVTVVGDGDGVTVLKSSSKAGYSWAPLATLAADSVETDRWIANWCLTANGTKLVVVYGTRTMVNEEDLMDAGGWAAIVDTSTGVVTSLGRGYTMAYFNPSCGPNGTAALTAFDGGKTLIGLLDAAGSKAVSKLRITGEVTSATPDAHGNIVAVSGDGIKQFHANGTSTALAKVAGSVHSLSVDATNKLTYITNSATDSQVNQLDLSGTGKKPTRVASGPITGTGVGRDATGRLYLLGSALKVTDSTVPVVDAPPDTKLSSNGLLGIVSTSADIPLGTTSDDSPNVSIDAVTPATGKKLHFSFHEQHAHSFSFAQPPTMGTNGSIKNSVSIAPAAFVQTSGTPATSPIEPNRYCAIPRNDLGNQVMQPKPRQVEWAVNMAVLGHLTTTSTNNLSNLGSSTFSPQGMFPLDPLIGGGHIPSQVVLGVLAQESNLWQADKYTSPGSLGNPLIGNFYGTELTSADPAAFWVINFPNADCGYGVGQITDGMRLAGDEAGGVPALPAAQQRAIAVDYSSNIAKVVQTLGSKWNQVAGAGITVNGGSSSGLESWFFAVWAYNTGFHGQTGSSPWGVGWSNNPVNPIYNPSRLPFLQYSAADAATPQYWPYPEKVMGFAAWSLGLTENLAVQSGTHPTGYTTTTVNAFNLAWWDSDDDRTSVKPPTTLFCTVAGDQCDPSTINKCTRMDFQCWWHTSVSWKSCPTACGHENVRFTYPTYALPAQADGTSLPGRCDQGGLPGGAMVVDDVPATIAPVRAGCTQQSSWGSFAFQFYSPDANGNYQGKVDLHQQGGGFNDHFYFTHVRNVPAGDKEEISGTWSLGQSSTQWTRVFVHVPSYAAWSPQAAYQINFGDGTSETRTVNQRRFANEWVQLGVFHMNGVPSVTLTNLSNYADGFDDIAWDAVAFQPLSAKPADFVVALGDSFSSGEGATTDTTTGASYTSESDHDGTDASATNSLRDGCHRSTLAWSRKAALPDSATSIGSRSDSLDASLDYHLLACSGAVSANVSTAGTLQYGERDQVDQGYLDSNTTLVTVSIGGNDVHFSDVLFDCVTAWLTDTEASFHPCDQQAYPGSSSTLHDLTASRLAALPALLATDLSAIHSKAPNAKIVLMGYPELFETGSSCINIDDRDRTWLNSVSSQLESTLSAAATTANAGGTFVKFENPEPFFTGHNLCASSSAENGLVFHQSPGDKPMFSFPVPGPNFNVGVSQQSAHPNPLGTTYYASALQDALGGGFYP